MRQLEMRDARKTECRRKGKVIEANNVLLMIFDNDKGKSENNFCSLVGRGAPYESSHQLHTKLAIALKQKTDKIIV